MSTPGSVSFFLPNSHINNSKKMNSSDSLGSSILHIDKIKFFTETYGDAMISMSVSAEFLSIYVKFVFIDLDIP